MGTRKSVDKILDDAANILEKHGFTTSMCYDPHTGGYCALGAIARAAYPKKTENVDLDDIALETDYEHTRPDYRAAVDIAARAITRRKTIPDDPRFEVYSYNDSRVRRPKSVVKMLRRAAELARKEAAPV